jgi:hypothetical protein
VWIRTNTDKERDRLGENRALQQQLRGALLRVGYPLHAIPHVGFAFASQETVDRDFGGSRNQSDEISHALLRFATELSTIYG